MSSPRHELALAISEALPDLAVYDYEPDVIRLPAVIVAPAPDYITPDSAVFRVYKLDVGVLFARADERSAPDAIEGLIEQVLEVIDDSVSFAWTNVSGLSATEAGGQAVVSATITTQAWRT